MSCYSIEILIQELNHSGMKHITMKAVIFAGIILLVVDFVLVVLSR